MRAVLFVCLCSMSVIADEKLLFVVDGGSPQTFAVSNGAKIAFQPTTAVRYKCGNATNPPTFDGGTRDSEVDIGDPRVIPLRPTDDRCMVWHTSGTGNIMVPVFSVWP